jgi:hypothetical protein
VASAERLAAGFRQRALCLCAGECRAAGAPPSAVSAPLSCLLPAL